MLYSGLCGPFEYVGFKDDDYAGLTDTDGWPASYRRWVPVDLTAQYSAGLIFLRVFSVLKYIQQAVLTSSVGQPAPLDQMS